MNKQAALNTLKIVGFASGAAILAILFFTMLTASQIMVILGIGFLAYFIYMIYEIEKSRLEYKETLKKTVDR